MRKEDTSAQGKIVTEILQHLHACNQSVEVFYGRVEELEKLENYITGICLSSHCVSFIKKMYLYSEVIQINHLFCMELGVQERQPCCL